MPRSAREIDVDPRTYVGLSFPLRADNNNNFALTRNSIQQATHNLRNLLLTHPGERVGNPEFGSRLRELCFEQRDDQLPERLEEEIIDAVQTWLPYINIVDIATLTDKSEPNNIFVKIKFSTTLNKDTFQQITLDTGYTATQY
tara:strand:- start:43 stop:471 length:429 start_codon:yes stop_codon:yes gene_type:complete